jgi:hypothetical protein
MSEIGRAGSIRALPVACGRCTTTEKADPLPRVERTATVKPRSDASRLTVASPSGLQGVDLKGQVLFILRNASVADQHQRRPSKRSWIISSMNSGDALLLIVATADAAESSRMLTRFG